MRNYLILAIFCATLFSCTPDVLKNDDLIAYAPRKASVVIKVDDLKDYNTAIAENEFISKLNGTKLTEFLNGHLRISEAIKPKGTTLISYVKLGRNEYDISLITKNYSGITTVDSSQTAQITPTIQKIGAGDDEYFTAVVQDIFISSTSKLLIENAQRQAAAALAPDPNFKKAYITASSFADASALVNGKEAAALFRYVFPNSEQRPLQNSFDWSVADLNITNTGITLNGVLLTDATTTQKLHVFNGTTPVNNMFAKVTPLSATHTVALSIDDITEVRKNAIRQTKQTMADFDTAIDSLMTTLDEVALITLKKGEVFTAHTTDAARTTDFLPAAIKASTFRQVQLYTIDVTDASDLGNAFAKAYTNLKLDITPTYFCILEDFYVFAANQESLEAIIANYQNKSTLALYEPYTNANASLSSAATWSSVWQNSVENLSASLSEDDAKKLKDADFTGYPFALLQAVQDDGFMHLNGVLSKNEVQNENGAIAQVASIKLSADIASAPQLVKNHRTKGADIVVQDVDHNLYLISNSGKILWQKPLLNRIIGKIEQVDLYNNGRLQLAFTTPDGFHILDRDGNTVKPFPIKKEKDITVPVSIFDYENKSDYRFVVVQGDQVTMYDKLGNVVKGFTFTKAGNTILHAPKHLRILNKDYITITEAGGQLRILNRVGKDRIEVKQRIDFGDNTIHKVGDLFTTYDANGNSINVNTSGKFSKQETVLSPPFKMAISGKTTASLTENKLAINGKIKKLDYGSYTAPVIFTVAKKDYISITNTESSEVFVFDTSGALLPNFPIYGTSSISLDHLERNKSLGFVTQGDAKTILIYKMN